MKFVSIALLVSCSCLAVEPTQVPAKGAVDSVSTKGSLSKSVDGLQLPEPKSDKVSDIDDFLGPPKLDVSQHKELPLELKGDATKQGMKVDVTKQDVKLQKLEKEIELTTNVLPAPTKQASPIDKVERGKQLDLSFNDETSLAGECERIAKQLAAELVNSTPNDRTIDVDDALLHARSQFTVVLVQFLKQELVLHKYFIAKGSRQRLDLSLNEIPYSTSKSEVVATISLTSDNVPLYIKNFTFTTKPKQREFFFPIRNP